MLASSFTHNSHDHTYQYKIHYQTQYHAFHTEKFEALQMAWITEKPSNDVHN